MVGGALAQFQHPVLPITTRSVSEGHGWSRARPRSTYPSPKRKRGMYNIATPSIPRLRFGLGRRRRNSPVGPLRLHVDLIPLTLLARFHLAGFVVADDVLGLRVPLDLAAQPD